MKSCPTGEIVAVQKSKKIPRNTVISYTTLALGVLKTWQ